MNKQELIDSLAKKFGLSKVKTNEIITHALGFIQSSLVKKQKFTFIGFGSFSVKKRATRNGRNPQTGEIIKIPASKAVRFSAGKALKIAINKK